MSNFIVDDTIGMMWMGYGSEECVDGLLTDYTGKLEQIYSVDVNDGSDFKGTSPGAWGAFTSHFKCGACYYTRHAQLNYTINGATFSQLDRDSGRMMPSYDTAFTTVGTGGGTFHLTTTFKEGRPVFKNLENGWWCWFNGTTYVMSHPEMSETPPNKVMKNGSKLPNFGNYEGPDGSSVMEGEVLGEECYKVESFSGTGAYPHPSSANGDFCESGMMNGKKKFTHESGKWFIYWDDPKGWVLTDTPYNTSGNHIYNGTGDKLGNFVHDISDDRGSLGFDGQSGQTKSYDVPEGSLFTEVEGDDKVFLRTEETEETAIVMEDAITE